MIITSTSNPQIKTIRKLRERKERQESGLFFIEGLRIVAEAISQQAQIEFLIVAPDLLSSDFGRELLKQETQKGSRILEVSADVFESLASKEGPQGLAAVLRQSIFPLEQVKLLNNDLWVALDAVADPGNLGTILRTLDAVGGQGVILLEQCTDPYDLTSVRASMGALFDLKIVKSSFEAFAAWKQNNEVALIGTSGAAQQDYHLTHYPQPFVLLMGSERHGLLEKHLRLCDAVVSIPMMGKSDSLNLAVSTAIVLYEVFNQRRDEGSK
jgi:RNA methyltransferase, TrmH family